jgi:CelD/BcsL family acetyltransferase involved in cellulose biosynthesis
MPYFVERINDFAALRSLTPEWEELDGSIPSRTPFTSPSWNLLWWHHFSEKRLWLQDDLFVLVVLVVRDEQRRLIAIAPLMRTQRPAAGPWRMREIQFFGADPNITELRGPVCRPEHRAEATRMLQAHLMERAGDWDSLQWCGVPDGDSVEALGAPAIYRDVHDYSLHLPASWAVLVAGLSRNMKEALRKGYNSLRRAGHAFTFRTVSAPAEVGEALDIFFRLHRERAGLAGSVTHPDAFRSVRSRRFLRAYGQDMSTRGQLRIFQLVIDDQIVATRIGFVFGDQMYLYYSGYSRRWSRFSVMTTLTAESIKWALDSGFRIVNLSSGNDYAKTRWQPVESVSHDYTVQSPLGQNWLARNSIVKALRSVRRESMLGRVLVLIRRSR